jgi:hypothetical protein
MFSWFKRAIFALLSLYFYASTITDESNNHDKRKINAIFRYMRGT